uniref:Uncharacterized protein n=1 Tax=Cacopsylla melanoneura TaxID=428564 RepID=A0A8D8LXC4_9HEMI
MKRKGKKITPHGEKIIDFLNRINYTDSLHIEIKLGKSPDVQSEDTFDKLFSVVSELKKKSINILTAKKSTIKHFFYSVRTKNKCTKISNIFTAKKCTIEHQVKNDSFF